MRGSLQESMWRPSSQISPGNQARNWLLKQQTWGYLVLKVNANPTDQCVDEKGLSYKQIWKLSLPNYLTRLTGKMRLQYCLMVNLVPNFQSKGIFLRLHFPHRWIWAGGLENNHQFEQQEKKLWRNLLFTFLQMSYRHLIQILHKKK